MARDGGAVTRADGSAGDPRCRRRDAGVVGAFGNLTRGEEPAHLSLKSSEVTYASSKERQDARSEIVDEADIGFTPWPS